MRAHHDDYGGFVDHDTYSAEDLHNASYRYTSNSLGDRDEIVFRDPFKGVDLDPNRVPPSVAEDHNLRSGLNSLAMFGQEYGHRVTIAGAPHHDKSAFDMRQLEALIATHDVVFLEGIGNTGADRRLVREVGYGRNNVPDDFEDRWGRFKLIQLAALTGNNKPVFYADTPGDGTMFEDALIRWGSPVRELTKQARHTSGRSRDDLYRAALINISGNTIFREWNMLGIIGNDLESVSQQTGHAPGSSLFLIGGEHMDTLPAKLQMLRVQSQPVPLYMHDYGESDPIPNPEFDFTTAVKEYRAPITRR